MRRLDNFRIYYNNTIYPELVRLERRRWRLMGLTAFSLLLAVGLVVLHLTLKIWVLTLVLSIPITLYLLYLGWRFRQFVLRFKPNVLQLILGFMETQTNIQDLSFQEKGGLGKDTFLASRLFVTPAHLFVMEDFIKGKVGEMPFELCEMDVRENSPVRSRLNYVFKGVFMKARFAEELRGEIVVWPREFRPYLTRAIKAFTWETGENVDHEITNPEFRELFMVYANHEAHVAGALTPPMQKAMVDYYKQTGKEIYFSFMNRDLYIAVTEPRNILEPSLWRTNVSFELVLEFFDDIHTLLDLVEEFDKTH